MLSHLLENVVLALEIAAWAVQFVFSVFAEGFPLLPKGLLSL